MKSSSLIGERGGKAEAGIIKGILVHIRRPDLQGQVTITFWELEAGVWTEQLCEGRHALQGIPHVLALKIRQVGVI